MAHSDCDGALHLPGGGGDQAVPGEGCRCGSLSQFPTSGEQWHRQMVKFGMVVYIL